MYVNKIGICVNISSNTYKKFKSICALEGESMTARVDKLIKDYIEEYTEEHHIKI